MQKTEPKKNWTITPETFERLLEWFDEGKSSDGQNYLEMQQRLVTYFDRKNCLNSDELADETLNRVARRLEEEGEIKTESPAKYCYITARFVFLESLRESEKTHIPLDEILQKPQRQELIAEDRIEEQETKEKMLTCLENCIVTLNVADRELIISYYFGEERIKIENRRKIAEKLGISVNALSIRACRIRDKLETCVEKCVGKS